jgi:hypothetical protein
VGAVQSAVDAVAATFADLPEHVSSAPGLYLWLLGAEGATALAGAWLATRRSEEEARERKAGFETADWPTEPLPY